MVNRAFPREYGTCYFSTSYANIGSRHFLYPFLSYKARSFYNLELITIFWLTEPIPSLLTNKGSTEIFTCCPSTMPFGMLKLLNEYFGYECTCIQIQKIESVFEFKSICKKILIDESYRLKKIYAFDFQSDFFIFI